MVTVRQMELQAKSCDQDHSLKGQIMKKIPFYIVDVFAERKYAGNQLAVFRGAAALSGEEMQAITREIHFSESTFILSDQPGEGGYDVRIFTPKEEVPFAGHPTLGTAHIIRTEILHGQAETVILNLKVGQIPVTASPDGYGWMKQIEPVFGRQHAPETLAAALGLEAAEIDERFPVEEVSTGLPFFIVPLKTLGTLKSAKIEQQRYYDLIKDTVAKGILVFCPETYEAQNDLSVRVFVDYYGVPEDPATGSGNGCLAAYVVKHSYFGRESINLRIEQGCEIGRPSLLLLKAEQTESGLNVSVGGRSLVVAQGEFV
jgi:trans-2,3-dihydro-3-hydroxyanthranilate isomerase